MKAWEEIRAGSAPAAGAFRAAMAEPGQAQRALLAQILAENADTAFGRSHGFARIDSYEAYREAVPIRGYDGFADEIAEMAEGAGDRVIAGPCVAFERTGGTTSGGKLVPFGARALEGFAAAVLPMLHDLIARHPGVTNGRLYASISPATRAPEVTRSGVPVGTMSDAAYLGPLAAPFARLLAVPAEVGAIPDVDGWRLETLAHLLEADDLSFVTIWSPSFLTALIEALPGQAERLLPRLSSAARRRFEIWLADDSADTSPLWPHLAAISCWTDAGSAPFAAQLAKMCPQASLTPKGVIATEGAITVPVGQGPGAYPALTSSVIEFRAPGTQQAVPADALEPGRLYDAILTTQGGFYRYDIGDRFRCVGLDGVCPRLVFEGRAGVVSDMVGEKLDEGFVARVLAALDGPSRLEAIANPPHYALMLAPGTGVPDLAALDRALGENPQYAYARKIGQLGAPTVQRDGFIPGAEAEANARRGLRLGDSKSAVLVPLSSPTD